MMAGVSGLGLAAAYAALGVLLLSLNLRAAWPWQVKAGAIVATGGFIVGSFLAVQAMLGWPTERTPPAAFRLEAALVDEPDPRRRRPGAIYLWLSEMDPERGVAGAPRAHALPYSRELHRAVAEAQRRLEEGREVRGRRPRDATRDGVPPPSSAGIELYTTDVEGLPPKDGARRPG